MSNVKAALLVAADTYQDPKFARLRAPADDVAAFARVLGDAGIGRFDVRTLMNEPSVEVCEQIEGFFADSAPGDLLLLYFSCHGVKDAAGRLYFVATNTKFELLGATGVSSAWVNEQLDRSPSKRIVLLLDCCYSGAFVRGLALRSDGGVQILERFSGQGRVVITASDGMEYAYEGDELSRNAGQPSVFTRALVDGLKTGEADRDRDGWIGVGELYGYVYDQVRQATPHQTPTWSAHGLRGELHLARSPHPAWLARRSIAASSAAQTEPLGAGAEQADRNAPSPPAAPGNASRAQPPGRSAQRRTWMTGSWRRDTIDPNEAGASVVLRAAWIAAAAAIIAAVIGVAGEMLSPERIRIPPRPSSDDSGPPTWAENSGPTEGKTPTEASPLPPMEPSLAPPLFDDFGTDQLDPMKWKSMGSPQQIYAAHGRLHFDVHPSTAPGGVLTEIVARPSEPVREITYTTRLASFTGSSAGGVDMIVEHREGRDHAVRIGPSTSGQPAFEFSICRQPSCDGQYNSYDHPSLSIDTGQSLRIRVVWTGETTRFFVNDVLQTEGPVDRTPIAAFKFLLLAGAQETFHVEVDDVRVAYAE